MSFIPHQSDDGLQPWEYYPAAAGAYKVGQMLTMTGGKLTAISAATKTTPPYVCMAEKTVVAGELIPVMRVTKRMIFETSLSSAAASATIGSLLEVSAGGLEVDAAAAGTFETTYIDGTDVGAMVRGRFQ